MPSPAQLRAKIGRAHIKKDPDEIADAQREYYTEDLAAKIRATVAKAPPLTPEQIAKLRALLPLPATTDDAEVA